MFFKNIYLACIFYSSVNPFLERSNTNGPVTKRRTVGEMNFRLRRRRRSREIDCAAEAEAVIGYRYPTTHKEGSKKTSGEGHFFGIKR